MRRARRGLVGGAAVIGGLFALVSCVVPEYAADQASTSGGDSGTTAGTSSAHSAAGGRSSTARGAAGSVEDAAGGSEPDPNPAAGTNGADSATVGTPSTAQGAAQGVDSAAGAATHNGVPDESPAAIGGVGNEDAPSSAGGGTGPANTDANHLGGASAAGGRETAATDGDGGGEAAPTDGAAGRETAATDGDGGGEATPTDGAAGREATPTDGAAGREAIPTGTFGGMGNAEAGSGGGLASGGTSGGAAGDSPGGQAGQFGGMAGAGGQEPCTVRDCTTSADNNCDGVADWDEEECECPTPEMAEPCTVEGAVGVCETGIRTCVFATDDSTSAWSECIGPNPGNRNCLSMADNDCDGNSDQLECGCPLPDAIESCVVPGALGVCANGTRACQFAVDNSSSAWSACVGPSAGTRDCGSANDNDCNGTPDNAECSCSPAAGLGATAECGLDVQINRVGACSPGSQTCIVNANDPSTAIWGDCMGGQVPTTPEGCGPEAVDTTCNGIPGDGTGSGCATTITIYAQQYESCSCSSVCTTSTVGYRAAQSSPGADWIALSQFRVYEPTTNTGISIPVHNCSYADMLFVQIGGCTPRTGSNGGSASDLGIVGYVSSTQPGSYTPLYQQAGTLSKTVSSGCSGTTITVNFDLPVAAGSEPSGYYTLP